MKPGKLLLVNCHVSMATLPQLLTTDDVMSVAPKQQILGKKFQH
jgi:hypothetical protein